METWAEQKLQRHGDSWDAKCESEARKRGTWELFDCMKFIDQSNKGRHE